MAGGRRSWSEKVAKAPSPNNLWGASVVKMGKMEFCKRGIGERSNSSLERVQRGEEDSMVGGGQGGVGGGGNGGEVLEVIGCFDEKWRKKMVVWLVLRLLLLVEWRRIWKRNWWKSWR